jgi:ornithine cyclodeaminase/alanine dehydrogenase-like protein (mu-crystallin family)
MLYLTEQDVTELLTMPEALAAVERAFRALAVGDATSESRRRVRARGSVLMTMSAAMDSLGVFGLKAYTVAAGKARFHISLYDALTGDLLALIEADKLGQMRTGAASGIATKFLARENAETVGIYGTGWQAQSQLEAVCAVRKISRIKVFSRSAENREKFCQQMSQSLAVALLPVAEPEAAADADIVITITSSREPVLKGAWLRPGTHLNAAGGNSILRREFDDDVLKRASFLTADSLAQSQMEAGEFVTAVEKGLLKWERVQELRHVVNGEMRGRKSDDDITLFKSLGLAIEDVVTAEMLYRKAKKLNIGKML